MAGGLGNDTFVVDNMLDVATELATQGTDLVQSSVSFTLRADIDDLELTGVTSIDGTGNLHANRLTGNSAFNTMSGQDGSDVLIGMGGNDRLTGGNGAEHFVFVSRASGIDTITDFNELAGGAEQGDRLRFEGIGVGVFTYLGTGAFTGGSNNSEARVSGNQVLVDSDGNGSADITILLSGLTSAAQLAASDFVWI